MRWLKRATLLIIGLGPVTSSLNGQQISGSGTPGSLAKFQSGTSVGNSSVFEANGSVGIGTSSPSMSLDVNGKASVGPRGGLDANFLGGTISLVQPAGVSTSLAVWQGGVGSAHFGFRPWDSKLHIVNSYRTGLISEATEVVLDTGGNFGIGTANPADRLDVNGNIRLSGSGTGVIFPDGTRQATAQLIGPKGNPGTNGTNGTNGINGTNGAKGDKGDKGDIGPAVRTFGVCVYAGGIQPQPLPCANVVGKSANNIATSDTGSINCLPNYLAYVCKP